MPHACFRRPAVAVIDTAILMADSGPIKHPYPHRSDTPTRRSLKKESGRLLTEGTRSATMETEADGWLAPF
jgi:hypothetical protein